MLKVEAPVRNLCHFVHHVPADSREQFSSILEQRLQTLGVLADVDVGELLRAELDAAE